MPGKLPPTDAQVARAAALRAADEAQAQGLSIAAACKKVRATNHFSGRNGPGAVYAREIEKVLAERGWLNTAVAQGPDKGKTGLF